MARVLAYRLTGSSDLYQSDGRRPYASVNFVTSHDGFTLADLVSCNLKHNEANDTVDRDGADENFSWNCGVEGPTEDPAIIGLRRRQMRNFLATLLLSQGVPMLCGGDEIGRTQRGNNNAYCHDNELSWHDWTLDAPPVCDAGMKDLTWFRSDGQETPIPTPSPSCCPTPIPVAGGSSCWTLRKTPRRRSHSCSTGHDPHAHEPLARVPSRLRKAVAVTGPRTGEVPPQSRGGRATAR